MYNPVYSCLILSVPDCYKIFDFFSFISPLFLLYFSFISHLFLVYFSFISRLFLFYKLFLSLDLLYFRSRSCNGFTPLWFFFSIIYFNCEHFSDSWCSRGSLVFITILPYSCAFKINLRDRIHNNL